MLLKICNFPLMTLVLIQSLVGDLRRDERGLSGVVVAVLLILVAVLAVVLIWGFLSGWIQDLFIIITGQQGSLID